MIYLIALICALTGFLFGFDEGIISGVLHEMKEEFQMTSRETGFMMGLMPFGAFIAACFIGRFSDWSGRLLVLFLVPIFFSFGIFVLMLTSSYKLLCVARLLLGISIGMSVVVSPLYISEAAPEDIRGKLVIYFQLAITLGIFCAYLVNLFAVDYLPWRWMFATGLIPSTLLFFGAFFLPESPRWLCARGKVRKAEKVLCRLHDRDHPTESVKKELAAIQESIRKETKATVWRQLFSPSIRPCLALGMLLFLFQQLSGINVVIYYAPTIFKEMQLGSHFVTLLATLGIGAVNVIMTVLAMRWVEKIGRRPLLMIGFIGTALTLFIVGLITYLDIPEIRWIAAVSLFIYIGAFAVGLGPLPWVMMPEIFPLKVRGPGAGLSAGSNWAFNSIVVATFPVFLHTLGISWTFLIYAITCVIGFLFTLYYVPETKGLSLEAIEEHVRSGKPLRLLGREDV
jgi:sugar porter (SP) family MFS transporter